MSSTSNSRDLNVKFIDNNPTVDIFVRFGKIKTTENLLLSGAYHQKIRNFVAGDKNFNHFPAFEEAPLPLAAIDWTPEYDEMARQKIDELLACFQKRINKYSPLLDSEQLQSELFTYLSQDVADFPKGSVVFQRETNIDTHYFIIPSIIYEDASNSLTIRSRTAKNNKALASVKGDSPFKDSAAEAMSKLIELLLKKFLVKEGEELFEQAVGGIIFGGIANMIFGSIFDTIFNNPEENFLDYLNAFQEIVHQEIQEDTVTKINGAFQEIITLMGTEYTTIRSDSDPLSLESKYNSLYDMVKFYIDTLTLGGAEGVIGTLMTDNYCKIGLPAFMLGATLHISLIQEQSNLVYYKFDKTRYDDYTRSNDGVIAKQAAIYSQFIINTWLKVKKDRSDQIKVDSYRECTVVYRDTVCNDYEAVFDCGKVIAKYDYIKNDDTYIKKANNYYGYYYLPWQLDILSRSLGSPAGSAYSIGKLVATPTGETAEWPPQVSFGAAYRYFLRGSENDCLNPDDTLSSTNEEYYLRYQKSGMIELFRVSDGHRLWQAGSASIPGCAFMQPDGNFVVYDAKKSPVFSSDTAKYRDAFLIVSNDGRLQIRSLDDPGTVYWQNPQ